MFLRRLTLLALALLAGAALLVGSPASATQNPDYTAPPPTTVVTTPTPTTPTEVKTAVAVTPARTRLAITGSDAATTAAIGTALVLTGAGLLVVRRRRAAAL